MNAKHLQLICKPPTPLLITLKCILNIFASCHRKGLSVPGQDKCTTDVHRHRLYGQYIQMKGGRYILHVLIYFYTTSCTIILQMCEHLNVSAKGHTRKHTVGRGHQPGLTPNSIF